MSSITKNIQKAENYDDIFLPESVVRIVIKVAKIFEMRSIDEFSLMATLHHAAILKNSTALDGDLDEKSICIIILNIIKITDKFNSADSEMCQAKLGSFFAGTGISAEEFNKHEFEVFKSLNFEVVQPLTVEMIFKLITTHLSEQDNKVFLFEIALDVLRVVYLFANDVFTQFTRDFNAVDTKELKQDKHLLAAAVFMVLLKILNVSDRVHNQVFDVVAGELGKQSSAGHLNKLLSDLVIFYLNSEYHKLSLPTS